MIKQSMSLSTKDLEDIRRFIHDKYKMLDIDSDELADFVCKETHKLEVFFEKYAEQMQDNIDTSCGWQPMALYHSCLLGQIHHFIKYAHRDMKDDDNLSNSLRPLNF